MIANLARRTAFASAALFCAFAVYVCAITAPSILHLAGPSMFGFPGWQVVQAGIVFLGTCYAVAGLFFAAKAV